VNPLPSSSPMALLGCALTMQDLVRAHHMGARSRGLPVLRHGSLRVRLPPPPPLEGARRATGEDDAVGITLNRQLARQRAMLLVAQTHLHFMAPPVLESSERTDDRTGLETRQDAYDDQWFDERDRALRQWMAKYPDKFRLLWDGVYAEKYRAKEPLLIDRYRDAGMTDIVDVLSPPAEEVGWDVPDPAMPPVVVPKEPVRAWAILPAPPTVVPRPELSKEKARIGSRQRRRRALRMASAVPVPRVVVSLPVQLVDAPRRVRPGRRERLALRRLAEARAEPETHDIQIDTSTKKPVVEYCEVVGMMFDVALSPPLPDEGEPCTSLFGLVDMVIDAPLSCLASTALDAALWLTLPEDEPHPDGGAIPAGRFGLLGPRSGPSLSDRFDDLELSRFRARVLPAVSPGVGLSAWRWAAHRAWACAEVAKSVVGPIFSAAASIPRVAVMAFVDKCSSAEPKPLDATVEVQSTVVRAALLLPDFDVNAEVQAHAFQLARRTIHGRHTAQSTDVVLDLLLAASEREVVDRRRILRHTRRLSRVSKWWFYTKIAGAVGLVASCCWARNGLVNVMSYSVGPMGRAMGFA